MGRWMNFYKPIALFLFLKQGSLIYLLQGRPLLVAGRTLGGSCVAPSIVPYDSTAWKTTHTRYLGANIFRITRIWVGFVPCKHYGIVEYWVLVGYRWLLPDTVNQHHADTCSTTANYAEPIGQILLDQYWAITVMFAGCMYLIFQHAGSNKAQMGDM